MDNSIFQQIQAIKIENPTDKIIGQLRQLITSGQLKPGDRLPAERQLAESFGVGRSYVRDAIKKLELYGLLKTSPQSGTYVNGLSIRFMDSIITDIINFNKEDFAAMIEARYYTELNAVRLAAERRNEEDVEVMAKALLGYERNMAEGKTAVEDDMMFHLRIAKATQNSFIESMLLLVIPDLVKKIIDSKICGSNRGNRAIEEHREILDAIIAQDPDAAEQAMANHLSEILQISRSAAFLL